MSGLTIAIYKQKQISRIPRNVLLVVDLRKRGLEKGRVVFYELAKSDESGLVMCVEKDEYKKRPASFDTYSKR
jgi:hypothetical protein